MIIRLWLAFLLYFLVANSFVLVRTSPQGFISLDCGLPSNTTYTDNSTRILYTSDYDYISLAESKMSTISSNLITPSLPRQYRTIRSFPNETRNCYTFKAVEGQRYLIRAGFMYGNYDGLNSAQPNNPLQFDVYVDVNYWMTLDFIDESSIYQPEVLTIALANFLSLCLVNTGSGTPFISLLELRTLNSSMYEFANATHSLSLQFRRSLGPKTGQIIRYPYDPYDLSWPTLSGSPIWTQLSTNLSINTSASFGAPSTVLQSAATPVNSTALGIMFQEDDSSTKVFIVFYFAELVKLNTNQLREFNMYFNGKKVYGPYSPSYLSSDAIYTPDFITGVHNYSFLINATENSTLPPLLNAIEVYSGMFLTEPLTDRNEAEAMMSIKEQYQLKKNWMGDPCNPAKYSWQGVKCDYDTNNSTIVAVNLSHSELAGQISSYFSKLQEIKNLNLSNNYLNGTIPEFLAEMSSLVSLDLTGNNFSGPIPQGLLEKAKEGSLDLRYDCQYDNSCSAHGNSKKKLSTPLIIVIIVVGAIVKTLLVFIICKLCWKSRGKIFKGHGVIREAQTPAQVEIPPMQNVDNIEVPPMQNLRHQIPIIQIEGTEFTQPQIENMTKKFSRVIGKEGFGNVYLGYLENGTEVAVKVCSLENFQGTMEFLTEVKTLMKVHHRNLVSLIGYCIDRNQLAIIYEYMPEGSLRDHLKGRRGADRILSWKQRLQIVLDAGKGLEYLHTGCGITHRDVKTSNILLGANLEAKISDFGLSKFSKSIGARVQTPHQATPIVGTQGYIDPEYQRTLKFTYKSDVYSFGMVLLKILTAHSSTRGGPHIVEHVLSKLQGGNLDDIVDQRLHGAYSTKSVWRFVDLALRCSAPSSSQRPTMAEVTMQLKECLDLEIAHEMDESSGGDDLSQSMVVEFTRSK